MTVAVTTPEASVTSNVDMRLRALILVGVLVAVLGSFAAPARIWPSLLILGYYIFGIGVGAMYFLSTHHGANAGWATVFKRIPEALLPLVPIGGVIVAVALVLGGRSLYPWMGADAEELTGFKGLWLTPWFFYLRSAVYITVVSALALALRARSLRQDGDPSLEHTKVARRISITFLVLGTAMLVGASFDWFMALEPFWYSTMYGVYHFAGNFLTGLASITLILLTLRTFGVMTQVNEHHVHDLGKLVFAMSTFWMYIWFSQYMLIWYTNIPEETMYFSRRLGEGRTLLLLALPLVNWIIPFLTLLSQSAKKNPRVLGRICIVLLFGHWLDLFLATGGPAPGSVVAVVEVGAGLIAVGVAFLIGMREVRRAPLIPSSDPYLEESLHHHV